MPISSTDMPFMATDTQIISTGGKRTSLRVWRNSAVHGPTFKQYPKLEQRFFDGIWLSQNAHPWDQQQSHTYDLLAEANMGNCNPPTPPLNTEEQSIQKDSWKDAMATFALRHKNLHVPKKAPRTTSTAYNQSCSMETS